MAARNNSILIRNIYHMLAYAFCALSLEEYKDLAAEDFDHVHELFAAILAKGIACQVKRGLYREYCSKMEDLYAVHGKIALSGTIDNRMRRNQRVSCIFDELSENCLFNQILKTTALILLRHGEVGELYRTELRRVMIPLRDMDEVEPSSIRWGVMNFQRGNASYRFLMNVCRLVLEGMLITTEKGERKLALFVDERDMGILFQKFIREYYAAECSLVKTSAPRVKWVIDDDAIDPMVPIMQTDIMLFRGNDILIIETKFYSQIIRNHYESYRLRSDHLCQIFAYVKNKKAELEEANPDGIAHRVSGMLLYAKTNEEALPNFSHSFTGNKIGATTLNLNMPFCEIRAQLDGIVESYFGKAEA